MWSKYRKITKIVFIIVALLLVLVDVIIFTNANRTYSASDVLGDHADLNAENPFVNIESIDRGNR
ncbi:hypothetical protein [Psychrobacillus sp. BM2]|uniref:hypothetical protein n=1 Tax=Psychrobacillus sp. BM2 TaxID=3400421 RepID=UPI003B01596F